MQFLERPRAVTESSPGFMKGQPELGDEELVHQAKAGDRVAFEALVRRYQKPLYFLCFRYVRDHDAAADLAQRTFIRVLEKLSELREENTFKSWLFRIGANLALNHIRDHARFVEETEPGMGEEASRTLEADVQLEAAELAEALRQAVGLLPTKQRMTLELRIYEELAFKDIAVALNTTEGAAKVNFHYAVRRLRDLLGKASSGRVGGAP
jgi:RNA polymerase sigma-70 factor (ECF subfamily)